MKFMDASVRKLDMVYDRLELINYAFKTVYYALSTTQKSSLL